MRNRGRIVVTATFALLAVPLSDAGWARGSSEPGPGADPWRVAATLGLGSEDTATACRRDAALASSCYAVEGGRLIQTVDGGQTWTDVTSIVSSGVEALHAIDCPKACYLTATVDDGSQWVLVVGLGEVQAHPMPTANVVPTMSCAGSRQCTATDGTNAFVTHDGGLTWSTATLARIISTVPALNCVIGTSQCWAVGDNGEIPIIEHSADDGKTWATETAPAKTDGVHGVACPTTSTCYAVGANVKDNAIVIGTTDGGRTWRRLRSPKQDYPLRSISCAATTTCWAAGLDPALSPYVFMTSNGTVWQAQDFGAPTSTGTPKLSCAAGDAGAAHCVAVTGGLAFATDDHGGDWTDREVPTTVNAPQAMTCATRRVCVAAGNDAGDRPVALTSPDGGTSWTSHVLPRQATRVWDVDCPTVDVCYAITSGTPDQPSKLVIHALVSTDGGKTWSFGALDDPLGELVRLTCPSASTCLAIGFDRRGAPDVMATDDGGTSWHSVPAPSGSFYLQGVSCSSVTSCALVTQLPNQPPVAWTTTDLGATYQQHDIPDRDYFDLGCAGTTCVAVGADGGSGALSVSNDAGATWRARAVPRRAQILGRVTCGSTTACAATGFDFGAGGGPLIVGTTDAGAKWVVHSVPARQEQPLGVACARSWCLASDVSELGNPLILAGRA